MPTTSVGMAPKIPALRKNTKRYFRDTAIAECSNIEKQLQAEELSHRFKEFKSIGIIISTPDGLRRAAMNSNQAVGISPTDRFHFARLKYCKLQNPCVPPIHPTPVQASSRVIVGDGWRIGTGCFGRSAMDFAARR
jgi:hypothetical protein